MRRFMIAFVIFMVGLTSAAVAEDLIPPRRIILLQDTDMPGGDIASVFDTTLEACERACLDNDACTAMTFNTNNASCFAKSGAGEGASFAGALSGLVMQADATAIAQAPARRADLTFVQEWELSDILTLARNLVNDHSVNGWTADDLRAASVNAEGQGDITSAANYTGALVNLTDTAADWVEYSRLEFAAAQDTSADQTTLRQRAYAAAVNAYLRAGDKATRHTVLVQMAQVLEQMDRGRDTVAALRLAQSIQSRDDTAAYLADAAGKYGFRVQENRVESDLARPRLCVTFSEELSKDGVDYANYVKLDAAGLTVSQSGSNDLCVEGVEHGSRHSVTLRKGLPAATGETLSDDVTITSYIRDRAPAVRFPGRAYVLPKSGAAAVPVETVNTRTLDLTLYHVTDRSLVHAVQSGFLAAQIGQYDEETFGDQVGSKVWQGHADVGMEVNADMTTRLPLDAALAGQAPGVYALRAAVPGVDPYTNAPAWQWFTISDLGITTLSGTDGLHVFVRALGSAAAKAGVNVQLLSQSNEVLGEVATDDQGYARFDAGLLRGQGGAAPAMIVAHDGTDDTAFLSLTDPEFDLSDRGVAGREAPGAVDVFLTTDRGAYRAGETVYATALSRDSASASVEGVPLTAVLRRPDGMEYSRALAQDGGAGGHVFALPVGASAPRGVWKLDILADADAPPLASTTVLVEDFLPERIDFGLTLPDQIRLGDIPEVSLTAKYLFGAPGADLGVEGEVLVRAAAGLPEWPGYTFGRASDVFSPVVQSFSGVTTDASGKASFDAALPAVADAPDRPLEALFAVRVSEGSARPVERRETRLILPEGVMIGLKPAFDGVPAENSDAAFQVIALKSGKPAAAKAKWELTRINTDYQWYQSYGSWNWEPVTTRERVADGTVDLGDTPATLQAPVKWGEYELSVSIEGQATTTTTFSAGWYAAADVTTTPDMLEMSLDKASYKVGDVAHLRVVPKAAGTALVSVLTNRLIAMKAVEVGQGETIIDLPVTDDWGPGVYVTASVLRPMDVAAGRNPSRALGVSHAAVDPGARALTARIETLAETAPRGPLDVAVKVDGVAPGETAYVTLAAVDQGILNLTGYTPPDPQDYYFGQRKLGVAIRDIYGRLIDGLNGAEGKVRSGGDGGATRLMAPPPTEQLVAFFTGPVTVGEDGYARTTFDLPAFNGTVKVMAVAWSKTGVGQASADVLVRDPVVVTASLPRFMAPGDTSRLLLEFVHAKGPAGQMPLQVTAQGATLGDVPTTVTLTDGGKARLEVPVTADATGVAQIDVALTTPDGKVLTKTLSLPVQVNDPETVRISRFDLKKGQTFTFDQAAFAGLAPGARATLAAGPVARLNAPGILAALDRYPYGCTEQITSKALPLLYFDETARALDLPGADDIQTRLQQAVSAVLTNQGTDGGFGLWAPGSGDFWLDAFVTDFLSRARARGYQVPDAAFRMALDNLRNQVNYQADFDQGGEALAYALMVLAREGAAAIGDLRYYADVKADAFSTPLALGQLGAALASYGDQPRADAMFAKAADLLLAQSDPDTPQVARTDYGTYERDAAGLLTLAVESGSKAVDAEALANQIATAPVADAGLSTQEATWTLLAANALIDRGDAAGLMVDGAPASGPLVRALTTASAPVAVKNTGADTTLTVTTLGQPSEPVAAGGNGYGITRSYYTLTGEAVDPTTVKVGTRLVAVLEVTPYDDRQARLMVSDPLPAGFEIDNPNLISGGSLADLAGLNLTSDVAHSEFRQDRFLTAIDHSGTDSFRLGYVVRVVSPGVFRHPAASVEDMYVPANRAWTDAGQVTVTE